MLARNLLAAFAAIAFALASAPSARAQEKTPDVFLDEGSGDDFAEPAPMPDPGAATAQDEGAAPVSSPAPAKTKAAKKGKAAAAAAKSAKSSVKAAEEAAERAEAQAEELAGGAETPAKKAKAKAPPAAGLFKTTKGACPMHASPSDDSAKLIDVAAGRKLWVEPAGDGWFKAFRKTGEGYLSSGCF